MPGTDEEAFLDRVRTAIGSGAATGSLRPLRARRGEPGGGGETPDERKLLDKFLAELLSVGGQGYRTDSPHQAVERLSALVKASNVTRIVAWRHPLLSELGVPAALEATGCECWEVSDELSEPERRSRIAMAEMGITAVDHAVVETGSLVLCARPDQPRMVGLLPPVHVAFLAPGRLVADLEALAPLLRRELGGEDGVRNITFITGPSRTADIELSLTRGVHGPKEVHVFSWSEESTLFRSA